MKVKWQLFLFIALLASIVFGPTLEGLRAQSGHNITLTWTAASSGTPAITYNVKRSVSSGTETTIGTTTAPTVTYVDTTGAAGTKYFYVITAVNPSSVPQEGPPSNEVSATFLPLAAPGAPGGLGAVSN
jgi:hypothetical protein